MRSPMSRPSPASARTPKVGQSHIDIAPGRKAIEAGYRGHFAEVSDMTEVAHDGLGRRELQSAPVASACWFASVSTRRRT